MTRDRILPRLALPLALLATAVLPTAACGGGGGPGPAEAPPGYLDFAPDRLDGGREAAFTIRGVDFRPVGSDVRVTFNAAGAGLFFAGSSPDGSRILAATGTVVSETEILGRTPYAGVVADFAASLRVEFTTGAQFDATDVTTFEPGEAGVRGAWTYEAPDSTPTGLDYASVSERPVRRARVQLVDDATGTVVTTRVLGDDGSYAIPYGMDAPVRVRVLAQTGPPAAPIQVEDNTNANAIWANEGIAVQVDGGWVDRDYVVPLGWSGAAYDAARASGPFSILDAVYEATRDFLAVRSPAFPLCRLNWSPRNRPEWGSLSDGAIGTSFYEPTGNQIYLLGQEDVDTDEYDTHVVVHEWGHFFEANLARTDSIGGPHAGGDRLDPTVACGEGWCTALSALVLDPDATYTDALGPGQAGGFGIDLEDNASDTTHPGWFSEHSVQWIVYDLFDATDEAWDTVSLGFGDLYDVLTGTLRTTRSLTTIFALVDGLKDTHASSGAAIDLLCGHHAIDAVQDEWGTGESNDGGWSANLPAYHHTPAGTAAYAVTLDGRYRQNQLESVRLFYFAGTGGFITFDATTPPLGGGNSDHDISLELFEDGVSQGTTDDVRSSTESIRFPTKTSSTYVLRITDLGSKIGTYVCTVDVQSP